jgi:NAD-reducing hydrogenase small subunit
MPVHEAVQVDYFLPGCPPPADRIKALLVPLLEGAEPKLEGLQLKFG